MARVVFENVTCEFAGGVTAVDNLNLEIEDREFLVLLGPSGCGKSTTLRMLAGLEEAAKGTITIGKQVVNDVAPQDRDVAMVFQNYALYPHMSVRQNLSFGLELRRGLDFWSLVGQWLIRPWGWSERQAARAEIDEQVAEVAKVLGLESLLDRQPAQLSGGERQRVALGRAMVRKPAAFLFDEPLSNLDARLRLEMRRELKELHRRLSATMIYVTHDQVEALTLGDRIAVMNKGVLQQVGAPSEIYDHPRNRFVAGFVGSPPMNLLSGKLQTESAERQKFASEFVMSGVPAKGALASSAAGIADRGVEVELGVRPEDVAVSFPGSAESKAAESKAAAASGEVKFVESLGDATIVHVELRPLGPGESKREMERPVVLAKVEPRASWKRGQLVSLHFRSERLHVFDRATGEAL